MNCEGNSCGQIWVSQYFLGGAEDNCKNINLRKVFNVQTFHYSVNMPVKHSVCFVKLVSGEAEHEEWIII
jgi:hypothetical protein